MRALITGISGFAGHHLTAELLAAGYDVHGLVLNEAEPVPPGVSGVTVGDITDGAVVAAGLDAAEPDVVVHLAGASSVGQSFADPRGTWRVNLDGTLSVLEGVRARGGPLRLVAVTSGEVYGEVAPGGLPVDEATALRPQSPYGASKAAADLAVGQYARGFGLDAMRVRAFNHIGPGQDARFVVPTVARQIARAERDGAERIEVRVGNVDTRRDFTDVRDVVRAYRLIAERGDPAEPYLVCTGRSVAVRELIDGLCALARAETVVTSEPTRRREGEQPDVYGSRDRLTADTGWEPEIPLAVSLRDTLDWWRARVAEED